MENILIPSKIFQLYAKKWRRQRKRNAGNISQNLLNVLMEKDSSILCVVENNLKNMKNAYINSKFNSISYTCLVPLLFVVLYIFSNDFRIV